MTEEKEARRVGKGGKKKTILSKIDIVELKKAHFGRINEAHRPSI